MREVPVSLTKSDGWYPDMLMTALVALFRSTWEPPVRATPTPAVSRMVRSVNTSRSPSRFPQWLPHNPPTTELGLAVRVRTAVGLGPLVEPPHPASTKAAARI